MRFGRPSEVKCSEGKGSLTSGLFLAAVAFVISFLAGWPAYGLLVWCDVIDRPNKRSSHARPTARGGGLAILAAIFLVGGWLGLNDSSRVLAWLLGAVLMVAAVSMLDDLRGLSASVRFAAHVTASVGVLAALGLSGWKLELVGGTGWSIPPFLAAALGVLWLVGHTNAFNFMDGINGIAAGQATVAGLGMGAIAGVATGQWTSPAIGFCFVVGGAAAGFLPHNFPRARMFMGDVGSAPLGMILAALVLWLAHDVGWWLLIPLSLVHSSFVLDPAMTLIRRAVRHERLYEAHREHFYQRLVRAGHSHLVVTTVELLLGAMTVGLLVLYVQVDDWGQRIALAATVVAIWLGFFLSVGRIARRWRVAAALDEP